MECRAIGVAAEQGGERRFALRLHHHHAELRTKLESSGPWHGQQREDVVLCLSHDGARQRFVLRRQRDAIEQAAVRCINDRFTGCAASAGTAATATRATWPAGPA